MQKPIYFDYHATTPVDPRVLNTMLPYFGPRFGNAASATHSFGWEADGAVSHARKRVAELCGALPEEIVFTSGATESDNLALKGAVPHGGHIVTVASEHKAVLDSARRLEDSGCGVTVLLPRADGLVCLDELRGAIRPETVLVSVMYANNEIGVIQPVREIGRICREKRVLFHSDAVQAFGKIPVSVDADGIDLMSVTAHKMYGPKGVGALYVRRGLRLAPQMDGGGHENGMRSGTLNVPGIVGFGEACALAAAEMEAESSRVRALRDRLLERIRGALDGVVVHGSMEHRLGGNLNLSFEGVDGDALLVALPDLAVSAGSACASHGTEGSHVLEAIGVPPPLMQSAVRFGLGRFTTAGEVDHGADRVVEVVAKLRRDRPL
ncbi:MAG TPA: aminotransferase class V-fold PLP-dependent enzyme [Candidatus Acidoferrales bacterium]|nr:aminotransferase class V-fold PLP-dependent enzyme [Candidatus Acidoferrales bacterium]